MNNQRLGVSTVLLIFALIAVIPLGCRRCGKGWKVQRPNAVSHKLRNSDCCESSHASVEGASPYHLNHQSQPIHQSQPPQVEVVPEVSPGIAPGAPKIKVPGSYPVEMIDQPKFEVENDSNDQSYFHPRLKTQELSGKAANKINAVNEDNDSRQQKLTVNQNSPETIPSKLVEIEPDVEQLSIPQEGVESPGPVTVTPDDEIVPKTVQRKEIEPSNGLFSKDPNANRADAGFGFVLDQDGMFRSDWNSEFAQSSDINDWIPLEADKPTLSEEITTFVPNNGEAAKTEISELNISSAKSFNESIVDSIMNFFDEQPTSNLEPQEDELSPDAPSSDQPQADSDEPLFSDLPPLDEVSRSSLESETEPGNGISSQETGQPEEIFGAIRFPKSDQKKTNTRTIRTTNGQQGNHEYYTGPMMAGDPPQERDSSIVLEKNEQKEPVIVLRAYANDNGSNVAACGPAYKNPLVRQVSTAKLGDVRSSPVPALGQAKVKFVPLPSFDKKITEDDYKFEPVPSYHMPTLRAIPGRETESGKPGDFKIRQWNHESIWDSKFRDIEPLKTFEADEFDEIRGLTNRTEGAARIR